MAIYSKTGDRGETSIYGGKRVLKSDLQVEAYGSVDELTSFLGLALCELKNKKEKEFLILIQKDLHKIMAVLAGPPHGKSFVNTEETAVHNVLAKNLERRVKDFENYLDKLEKELPKIHKFILPSGSRESGWFHVLRSVCRRAERAVVRFFSHQRTWNIEHGTILSYLNRLSDLFFMLARKYNREEEKLV